ncbi:MAG TPA: haloacid dehalogenase type II [Segeticoccus sp.]|uniref:haloacid dehalogenase type II n=1 Tax=Segeticoccus sp. TaxID=2706531 RepID=UPI002D805730|nr:haloacid dehalogenase type II [Segeticoccus sp.]HET8599126.1 haloacid dehalogenase type II [Segeticoccus sp.]
MPRRPTVLVFDVNETLSDLAPMAARFTHVGAPARLSSLWFATLLRDGFAATVAGHREDFLDLARGALGSVLTGCELNRPTEEAIRHVLDGFAGLPVHADIAPGVQALQKRGFELVTLSNGSTQVAERLLDGAGLRQAFSRLMSVEDAGVWKPAPAAYAHAGRTCQVPLADMLMVAVHPWDLDGAARAGMQTAWLDRAGAPYPGYFRPPTYAGHNLSELAAQLP